MATALIIANTRAGRGAAKTAVQTLTEGLRGVGWDVESVATWAPSDGVPNGFRRVAQDGETRPAVLIAREAVRDGKIPPEFTVVLGGDGTLAEACDGLGNRALDTTILFCPHGNASLIAVELGLPRDVGVQLELLLEAPRTRTIDAMRVTAPDHRPLLGLAVFGVGFDAVTCRLMAFARGQGWGRAVYQRGWGAKVLYGTLGAMACVRLMPTRFRLEVDGVDLADQFGSAWIANSRIYSEDWRICAPARIDDGVLDHRAFRPVDPVRTGLLLRSAARHREPKASWSETGQGSKYVVTAGRPFGFGLDGDSYGPVTSVQIEICPNHLRFLVPSNS